MTLNTLDWLADRGVAILVALAGAALFVTSFVWSIPQRGDLHEVQGHLSSFYVKHYSNRPWWPGESKTWYSTVFKTEEGGIYYNGALTESLVRQTLRPGASLRFYITARPRHTLAEGAQPAYGLFVDGTEVQSLDSALGHERGMVRFGFPVLGLLLMALGYFGFWRRTRVAMERRHLTR